MSEKLETGSHFRATCSRPPPAGSTTRGAFWPSVRCFRCRRRGSSPGDATTPRPVPATSSPGRATGAAMASAGSTRFRARFSPKADLRILERDGHRPSAVHLRFLPTDRGGAGGGAASDVLYAKRDGGGEHDAGRGQGGDGLVHRVPPGLVGDDENRGGGVLVAVLAHPVDGDARLAEHSRDPGERPGPVLEFEPEVIGGGRGGLRRSGCGEARGGAAEGRDAGSARDVDDIGHDRAGGRVLARARAS